MSEQWIIKVLSTIHQSVGRKVVFSICFSSRYCRSVSVTAVCVGRRRVAESLSSVHTNRYSALESERSRHLGHKTQPDTPRMAAAAHHSPHRGHTNIIVRHRGRGGGKVWPVFAVARCPRCQCQCPDKRRGAAQSASSQWRGDCCDITSAVLWLPLQHDFTLDIDTNHIYCHNLYGWTRIYCWNDCQWCRLIGYVHHLWGLLAQQKENIFAATVNCIV